MVSLGIPAPPYGVNVILQSDFWNKVNGQTKKHSLKIKFSINDFFRQWDQIRSFLQIWYEDIFNGELQRQGTETK